MGKRIEALGVDIGGVSVKIAHIAKKGGKAELLGYEMLERGSVDAAAAAASFIKRNNIKRDVPVVVSLDGEKVFTRVFKLPAVGRSKLAKIIEYEAQQQVPFPIQDVIWTYDVLRKSGAEDTDICLVAARKEAVESLLSHLKSRGLEPEDVCAPVIALYRIIRYQESLFTPLEKFTDEAGGVPNRVRGRSSLTGFTEPLLMLDIGAKVTNILIKERDMFWMRTVPVGGNAITQAIADEFGLDFASAERLKLEKGAISMDAGGAESAETKKLSACIMRTIARLMGEVTRSLEVYSSSFDSGGIKKIIAAGGSSALRMFDVFLEKKFRVKAEKIDLTGMLELGAGVERVKFIKDSPMLAAAVGLSLQAAGLEQDGLSLLPAHEIQKRAWKKKRPVIFISAMLIAASGIALSASNVYVSGIYKANLSRLEIEKRAVSSQTSVLRDIKEKSAPLIEGLDAVRILNARRALWLNVLLAIEEQLSSSIWLTGIETIAPDGDVPDVSTATAVRIYGKTSGTYQEVVALKDALEKTGYFKSGSAEVVSAGLPKQGVREFTLQAQVIWDKEAGG